MYTLFFIIAHCYALRLRGTKKFWSENGHIDWWKNEWIDGQIKTQDDKFKAWMDLWTENPTDRTELMDG